MSNGIVTLTMNPAVDVFLEVDAVDANRKLRTATPVYKPGGGGINVSRAIARLRGTSIALFPAGGPTGDMLVTLLQRESIATDCVRIADATKQDLNVIETLTGREFRFIVPGPDLATHEWQHCLRALKAISPKPAYVVASGSLPHGVPVDFFARLAALALEEDFRLIVDTHGEPLRHAATKGTYLLKPNVKELATMTGAGTATFDQIEELALSVIRRSGVKALVVSTGSSGAMIIDRDHVLRVAAPRVPVIGRSGGGASMVAGFALSLARGRDLDEAVRYGVAAGTAALMRPGHRLCTYEDSNRLYEGMRSASERTPVTVAV